MNILYCGDENIKDGLLISILSLTKKVTEPLHIYVMTIGLETGEKKYLPLRREFTEYLDKLVKQKNLKSFVKRIDVTNWFQREIPWANMDTRFTPLCMLRLYADYVMELPDKILYLDNDVVCRMDFSELYHQNMAEYEMAGVFDYYGRWFFRKNIFRSDYMNSGVLLLNLAKIRESGLFGQCRKMCAEKKMFMPDQSALNKLCTSKKIMPRRYNEQRKLHKNTVLQHFTTSFRFFPWVHTLKVKPWQIDKMHDRLKLHEYDEILEEYRRMMLEVNGEN